MSEHFDSQADGADVRTFTVSFHQGENDTCIILDCWKHIYPSWLRPVKKKKICCAMEAVIRLGEIDLSTLFNQGCFNAVQFPSSTPSDLGMTYDHHGVLVTVRTHHLSVQFLPDLLS